MQVSFRPTNLDLVTDTTTRIRLTIVDRTIRTKQLIGTLQPVVFCLQTLGFRYSTANLTAWINSNSNKSAPVRVWPGELRCATIPRIVCVFPCLFVCVCVCAYIASTCVCVCACVHVLMAEIQRCFRLLTAVPGVTVISAATKDVEGKSNGEGSVVCGEQGGCFTKLYDVGTLDPEAKLKCDESNVDIESIKYVRNQTC